MNVPTAVDVHAHVFNAGYALREAVAVGWALLRGRYPRRQDRAPRGVTPRRLADDEGWRHLVAWVAGLLGAAVRSPDHHVAYERDECAASRWGTGAAFVTSPLMMDVYFVLHDNGDEEAGGDAQPGAGDEPPAALGLEAAFREHVEHVRQDVRAALGREAPRAEEALDGLVRDILRESDDRDESAWMWAGEDGVEWSPGYRRHLKDLKALRQSHGALVRPFLAVDPRRRGVMTLVREQVDPERGPFVGVKIYPPLGYLPSHPGLEPVLAHCAAQDIPVTVHASAGGFPTGRRRLFVRSATTGGGAGRWVSFDSGRAAAGFFSDPEGWRPVLDRYPQLRLNLAHFGGADDLPTPDRLGGTFAGTIVDLLECGRHPNLCTDIAFYPAEGLEDRLLDLIVAHPVLEERLLFGTDYMIVALDPRGLPLRAYFDRFRRLPAAVRGANALRFLRG